jgi:rSAM/selenodomain-associated transferase 1
MHVMVMAKAPVPGRVKTRLCPPCTPAAAAAVAEACLADTLDAVARCRADVKVLALDGRAGPWLPAGFDVVAQRGDGLGARLSNAWRDTADLTGGWGLQIGMDTPQVTAAELDALLDLVDRSRAVLGPAVDGGWWVIGLSGSDPDLVFRDVPMSRHDTGRAQEERLRALGLDVRFAPTRRDVDTIEDLVAVAAEIPGSRTFDATRRLIERAALAS